MLKNITPAKPTTVGQFISDLNRYDSRIHYTVSGIIHNRDRAVTFTYCNQIASHKSDVRLFSEMHDMEIIAAYELDNGTCRDRPAKFIHILTGLSWVWDFGVIKVVLFQGWKSGIPPRLGAGCWSADAARRGQWLAPLHGNFSNCRRCHALRGIGF